MRDVEWSVRGKESQGPKAVLTNCVKKEIKRDGSFRSMHQKHMTSFGFVLLLKSYGMGNNCGNYSDEVFGCVIVKAHGCMSELDVP